MLLISVKKCRNTGLAAQICVLGKKGDEFLIVHLNTTMGIDLEEGLIDLFFVDALEVEAQPACCFLLHNSNCLTLILCKAGLAAAKIQKSI